MKILRGHMIALALTAATAGCTRTISQGVQDDGSVDKPVFANERFLRSGGGLYADPAALQRLGPGMNKEQIRALVGVPHYREGYAAREWDYLFLFRTPRGDRSCQYKIVFDRGYKAQTLLWLPESCKAWVASATHSPPQTLPARVEHTQRKR